MTTQGRLDQRFFWERIGDDYLIFDRQRGAGCFGENFVATAVDGPMAELMCGLMNRPSASPQLFDGRAPANTTARLLS